MIGVAQVNGFTVLLLNRIAQRQEPTGQSMRLALGEELVERLAVLSGAASGPSWSKQGCSGCTRGRKGTESRSPAAHSPSRGRHVESVSAAYRS